MIISKKSAQTSEWARARARQRWDKAISQLQEIEKEIPMDKLPAQHDTIHMLSDKLLLFKVILLSWLLFSWQFSFLCVVSVFCVFLRVTFFAKLFKLPLLVALRRSLPMMMMMRTSLSQNYLENMYGVERETQNPKLKTMNIVHPRTKRSFVRILNAHGLNRK